MYKTIICLLTALVVMAATCSTKAQKTDANNCDAPVGCLDPSPDLGMAMVSVYAGTLDDGRYCVLTIFNKEHSGDGYFCIQTLGSGNIVMATSGRRYTLRGENDATIWECTADGSCSYMFLTSPNDKDTIYQIPDDSTLTDRHPLHLVENHKI